MGRGESVVDEQVTERGEPAREGRVVRLVLFMKAHVFEKEQLARLKAVDRSDRRFADAVLGEQHVAPDVPGDLWCDRLERELRFAILRPAQVRHHDHPRAALREVPQGRRRGADPRIVGDGAL